MADRRFHEPRGFGVSAAASRGAAGWQFNREAVMRDIREAASVAALDDAAMRAVAALQEESERMSRNVRSHVNAACRDVRDLYSRRLKSQDAAVDALAKQLKESQRRIRDLEKQLQQMEENPAEPNIDDVMASTPYLELSQTVELLASKAREYKRRAVRAERMRDAAASKGKRRGSSKQALQAHARADAAEAEVEELEMRLSQTTGQLRAAKADAEGLRRFLHRLTGIWAVPEKRALKASTGFLQMADAQAEADAREDGEDPSVAALAASGAPPGQVVADSDCRKYKCAVLIGDETATFTIRYLEAVGDGAGSPPPRRSATAATGASSVASDVPGTLEFCPRRNPQLLPAFAQEDINFLETQGPNFVAQLIDSLSGRDADEDDEEEEP